VTDANGKQICSACMGPLEPDRVDPFLCSNCLKEITADLQRLESESDATGFK